MSIAQAAFQAAEDANSRVDALAAQVASSGVVYTSDGYLFHTALAPSVSTPTSTFRGFSSRCAYNSEEIKAIKFIGTIEFGGFTLKCSIRKDSDHSIIAYKAKSVPNSGFQSILFVFDYIVGPELLTEQNFYISVEVQESSGCRISSYLGGATASLTATTGHANKYTTTNTSDWIDSVNPISVPLALEVIAESQISAVQIDPVVSIDTKNWDKVLALPNKIYGVVGHEMNIYFDNLMSDKAQIYDFNVICSVGVHQDERWTYVPDTAGTYSLQIDAYDNFYNLVSTATTSIIVAAANAKSGTNPKCLFIGDSLTEAEKYPVELNTLMNADVMDITFIGTLGTTPVFHEGRGGWKVSMYYTGVPEGSPFVFSNVFNFSQYMSTHGFASIDWIFIELGTNDSFAHNSDLETDAAITTYLAQIELMITNFKVFNQFVKVGIFTIIPPSAHQDSFGKKYDSGQTRFQMKRNAHRFNRSIITQFGGREASSIYVIPVNVNLDTVYNMITETVAVNSRNNTQIIRQANGVHPDDSGYYQMADSVYYALKNI